MSRLPILVLAALLSGGLVAGCGDSASDKVAEEVAEKVLSVEDIKVEGDEESGSIKLEGGDGKNSELTYGKELPDGFPDEIGLPDGAEIENATKVDAGQGTNFIVSAKTKMTAKEVLDFYGKELAGYKKELTTVTDEDSGLATFTSGKYSVMVAVAKQDSDRMLSLTVSPAA